MPARNRYACHPLLHKGGVHLESKSGKRSRDRQSLLDEVNECLEERDFEKLTLNRKEKGSPSDLLGIRTSAKPHQPFIFVISCSF